MGLDIREMLVCLATVATITLATTFALGAIVAYSYFAHSNSFAAISDQRIAPGEFPPASIRETGS